MSVVTAGPPEHAKTPPAAPPAAWAILRQALVQARGVTACYHGERRLLFPHALGWKHGRAKVVAYQAQRTSQASLGDDPRQRWRSMFVDELEDAAITDEPWQTADNYTPICNNIDNLDIEVNSVSRPHPRASGTAVGRDRSLPSQ